jgi:DNA-directed RNA polymerase beta subunit
MAEVSDSEITVDNNIDDPSSIDDIKAKPLVIKNFSLDIKQDDLFLIGDSLLDQRGLISHHLDSANNFYENGIRQIITQGFKIERDVVNKREATEEDKQIEWVHCEVIPTDVVLKPPTTLHYKTSKEIVLFPKVALAREKVYSGSLSFSCEVKLTAHMKNGTTQERTGHVKNFRISKVPVIKGSIMCNTYGKSKEALMQMGEDPSDPGGYFIVRGEWAVDCTENITYNQPKIYRNEGFGKSRVRCEFISKPGDTYQNSAMLLIRFFTDDTITLEIYREKLSKVEIPFFMIFRAMGWGSDKDMMDWIIYDYDSAVNNKLKNMVISSLNAKYGKTNYVNSYDQTEVLRHIVDMVPDDGYSYLDLKNTPDNYNNAITDVLRTFDMYCLPHIGLTSESRYEKLQFLALLIRKTILVHFRDIPQTDRDSYKNKRIHAAGDNYAKTFKTYFNQAVVMPIKRRMIKDVNSTPFSQINLPGMVKTAIYADDFERLIVQTIVSGNKASLKIKKKTVINRLATQQLNRKNQLNVMATMRQVSATSADSAKQSERASEMRRVHMSSLGYICTTHSPPEGEKVGINKQMAIFAFIAPSSSSEVLKNIVLKDKMLILDGKMKPLEISRGGFARVFVNGHLLGYTTDSITMINKYRQSRRNLEINPYTTIYWDNVQDEIQMFVDVGRMCRPVAIVYNNKRDTEAKLITGDFSQGLGLTNDDIKSLYRKTKSIDDLLREKKIEFITPEEQECCYICPNFNQLKRDKDDELNEYTHCDIPQALLGITTLTAPFGNHNSSGKVTYQTTQAKQTCGHYALNWPFRMDKETFLQYINETPLVRTAANKYLFPNGCNVMVAMACYTGYNQEDSLLVNKAAMDRGMFDGSKFSFYKTELEQKEELGNPDASKTDGLKSANYEKLHNGVVTKGEQIKTSDVLIGKYLPVSKDEKYLYTDRSIVYKKSEDAVVHNVIIDRNEDDARFAKVALRNIRPVAIGDKFSSRAGQKGIAAILLKESDMLFTKEGIRPTFVFNPHGIPSRMTMSQLIESMLGNVCAIRGSHHDGTMFKKIDIESVAEELEQHGLQRYGYERMMSGLTGEYVDTLIFFGPTFYQRLQKFVADAEYSVSNALTDAITYQPLEGQGSSGGLKTGEMEKDVIVSHGSSRLLHEKFFIHSDGYNEYICRTCGKPAIVNHKENIYKCKYCIDNADIVCVPTSWTSKLFMQEIESTNVGIRRIPKPFTYEKNDNAEREFSQIDLYNEDTLKKLLQDTMDSIDDINTRTAADI